MREIRHEARTVEALLRADLSHRRSLRELGEIMHLSPSQLVRVFVDSYGKSPLAYQTMLRVERMAELLSATTYPITTIALEVGWRDPDFASVQFRRYLGVAVAHYRRLANTGESWAIDA